MKKRVLLIELMVLCFIFSFNTICNADDYKSITEKINKCRRTGEVDLEIRSLKNSFQIIYQEPSALITEKEFTALNKATSEPEIGVTYSAKGYALEYKHIGHYLLRHYYEHNKYEKQVHTTLGEISYNKWTDFISEMINNGLVEISKQSSGEYKYLALKFRYAFPDDIISKLPVKISKDFFRTMNICREFTDLSGKSGFAILVHDPHFSRTGLFDLMPALHTFISDNSDKKFAFLVEGQYEDGNADIKFNGMDSLVDNQLSSRAKTPVIHSLLYDYVIDLPFAYRLLYDRNIPAYAIDDNKFLVYENDTVSVDYHTILSGMGNIDKKIQSMKNETKTMELKIYRLQLLSLIQLLGSLKGNAYIDYNKELLDIYKNLHSMCVTIGCDKEAAIFKKQSKYIEKTIEIFNFALARDKKMKVKIELFAMNKKRIPIAFIGSFHTDGIVSYLKKKGISYITIEPISKNASKKDQVDFDNALYKSSRQEYLKSLIHNSRKLPVSPSESEVADPISRIVKKRNGSHEIQIENNKKQIASLFSDKKKKVQLEDIISQNNTLMDATVKRFANGSYKIPKIDGSTFFAVLEPGNRLIHGHTLSIIKPEVFQGGTQQSVCNFLTKTQFYFPDQTGSLKTHSKLNFHKALAGNYSFITLYDKEQKCIFLGFTNSPTEAAKPFLPDSDSHIHIGITKNIIKMQKSKAS